MVGTERERESGWMGHDCNNTIAQLGKAEYKKSLAPKGARTEAEAPGDRRRLRLVLHDAGGDLRGIGA